MTRDRWPWVLPALLVPFCALGLLWLLGGGEAGGPPPREGRIVFRWLPPGLYRLEVRVDNALRATREVRVESHATADLDVSLDAR